MPVTGSGISVDARFVQHLSSSRKVLALIGSGLSASSGLHMYPNESAAEDESDEEANQDTQVTKRVQDQERESEGKDIDDRQRRTHRSTNPWALYDAWELATLDGFQNDPALVWQFYARRRAKALAAKPNQGHYALAELARRFGDRIMVVTQDIDGLTKRAGCPSDRLVQLHGDLFSVRCTNFVCTYFSSRHYANPPCPALKHCLDSDEILDIDVEDLPTCPQCKTGLLRPGVVWDGEPLPLREVDKVDQFVVSGEVDLILVIGTSCTVWPAASYVEQVTMRGGRMAVFDLDRPESLSDGDAWLFLGDAAHTLPSALEPVIGSAYVKHLR